MTTIVDELLAALRLSERLVCDVLSSNGSNNTVFQSSTRSCDTLLSFVIKLCQHCWATCGGPKTPKSLMGRCILLTAQHICVPESVYESFNESVDEFRLCINTIPQQYAILILPCIVLRFIFQRFPTDSDDEFVSRLSFCPDLLNFFVRYEAFCEVRFEFAYFRRSCCCNIGSDIYSLRVTYPRKKVGSILAGFIGSR